jgi:hypothetical protein
MTGLIANIRKTREFLLNMVDGLSIAQLNYIPEGFNNNIIWNLGHLIAAQQGLCYLRADLPHHVSEVFFNTFKPGSKPERFIDGEDFEQIKKLMFSTLDLLEKDYADQIFGNYQSWTTRYGVELASIGDALNFVLFHEGLHQGYVMALKRLVLSKEFI